MVSGSSLFAAIPPLFDKLTSWKGIPVIECGEKLVSIEDIRSGHRIITDPQYYKRSVEGALQVVYVRETVASMLVTASNELPPGLYLVIWDAWRPINVQKALFEQYLGVLRLQYPGASEEHLYSEALHFVSAPSEHSCCPSPHNTGGAVDVSIMTSTGKYLKMGTEFDGFCPRAHTRYFEDAASEGTLSAEDMVYLENRRILYHIMLEAGFTNYAEEWWHYDYGNQFWAAGAGQATAIYGSCSPEKRLVSEHRSPRCHGSEE